MNKSVIKKLAPFLVISAGIMWGSMGLFVRPLNQKGLGALNIVALRSFVTVIVMGAILLIFDRKSLKIKLKDIWCFVGTGICSIVFFNYCYFRTISEISLSAAAVLLYTAPAIVMVLSLFLFKEKISFIKLLALAFTIIGCVFVTGIIGSKESMSPWGILIGLGAGFGYALYSIFGRYAINKGYSPMAISFYTFLCASIGIIPLTDFSAIGKVVFASAPDFGFSVLMSIITTVAPYLTYTLGLKYTENTQAAILASVEPLVATIFGILVYDEKLTVMPFMGMALVLSAVVMCNLKPGKEKFK
ncbi:MAG: EamA family transporter [Oscillospiraceae bacterium]|nr:EamA family transporter [Oscillospiraceae bacterium]